MLLSVVQKGLCNVLYLVLRAQQHESALDLEIEQQYILPLYVEPIPEPPKPLVQRRPKRSRKVVSGSLHSQ
jgi:hypothetical protein